jgi:hypothetical protein
MPRGIPKNKTQETDLTTGADMPTTTASETSTPTRERAPRVSFSSGNKLAIPPSLIEDGYYYYWGLDEDGQLESLEAAYYDYVYEKGKKVTRPAGGGYTHYLMRIREEYKKEDFAMEQEEIDRKTQAQISVKKGQYSPHSNGKEGEGEFVKRERSIS